MLDTPPSPIGSLILECNLPKEISYYIAEAEDGDTKIQRFQEFSRDVRKALGPEFLNEEQRTELFNFAQKNVKSHAEVLLAYRKYASLLTSLHEKRAKEKGSS